MQISKTTLEVNRGNPLEFNLQIMNGKELYVFTDSDIVRFSIYEQEGLEKTPIIQKEFTPVVDTDNIDISLTENETKIGEMINKPVVYWYEITLNKQTIIGYDNAGPKLFVLYPEGSDTNE